MNASKPQILYSTMQSSRAIFIIVFLVIINPPFLSNGIRTNRNEFGRFMQAPDNAQDQITAKSQTTTNFDKYQKEELRNQSQTYFKESHGINLEVQLRSGLQESREVELEHRIQLELHQIGGIELKDQFQTKVQNYDRKELLKHTPLHHTRKRINQGLKYDDQLQIYTSPKDQLQTDVRGKNYLHIQVRDNQEIKFEGHELKNAEKKDKFQTNRTHQEIKLLNLASLLYTQKQKNPEVKFPNQMLINIGLKDKVQTEVKGKNFSQILAGYNQGKEVEDHDLNSAREKMRKNQVIKFKNQPQTEIGENPRKDLPEPKDLVLSLWTREEQNQKPQLEKKLSRQRSGSLKRQMSRSFSNMVSRTYSATKNTVADQIDRLNECLGGRLSGATQAVSGGVGRLGKVASDWMKKNGKTPSLPRKWNGRTSHPSRQNSSDQNLEDNKPESAKDRHDLLSQEQLDAVKAGTDFETRRPQADGQTPGSTFHKSPLKQNGPSVLSTDIPWNQQVNLKAEDSVAFEDQYRKQRQASDRKPKEGVMRSPATGFGGSVSSGQNSRDQLPRWDPSMVKNRNAGDGHSHYPVVIPAGSGPFNPAKNHTDRIWSPPGSSSSNNGHLHGSGRLTSVRPDQISHDELDKSVRKAASAFAEGVKKKKKIEGERKKSRTSDPGQ